MTCIRFDYSWSNGSLDLDLWYTYVDYGLAVFRRDNIQVWSDMDIWYVYKDWLISRWYGNPWMCYGCVTLVGFTDGVVWYTVAFVGVI